MLLLSVTENIVTKLQKKENLRLLLLQVGHEIVDLALKSYYSFIALFARALQSLLRHFQSNLNASWIKKRR